MQADEIYREVEKAAKPLGIELKLVGALRRGRPNADSIDIVMRHKVRFLRVSKLLVKYSM